MATESKTGLGVAQHYGPRDTGASIGWEQTTDSKHRLSLELTGFGLQEKFLPPIVMPKGATVVSAYIYVDEAFTGVTGLSIGTGNAEATDGITLVAADLALGGRDLTANLTGQWDTGAFTTAANRIGMLVTGTPGPNGRASLVLEVHYKRRNDNEWQPETASFPTGYTPQYQV